MFLCYSLKNCWFSMSRWPITYFSVDYRAIKFTLTVHKPSNSFMPLSFWNVSYVNLIHGVGRLTFESTLCLLYFPRFSILFTTHHLDEENHKVQRWCSPIVSHQEYAAKWRIFALSALQPFAYYYKNVGWLVPTTVFLKDSLYSY